MKKATFLLVTIILCIGLCACDTLESPEETTPPYLSQQEAFNKLKDTAEENLALAIGIPAGSVDVFKMKNYKITEATHFENLGYWYFEVKGSIPMYDDGLWYIDYTFDARVDDQTGRVTLGTLTKTYS